jgi:hypothetical protein
MMQEDSEKYAALGTMFGGQLHNDWTTEYGTWENAIDDFCKRANSKLLMKLTGDLDAILKGGHDEDALAAIANDECYANFYPPGVGMTYRGWLEKVDDMLKNWIEKKSNQREG